MIVISARRLIYTATYCFVDTDLPLGAGMLQSGLCVGQCARWQCTPQYRTWWDRAQDLRPRPSQPGLTQCIRCSMYSVCPVDAPIREVRCCESSG